MRDRNIELDARIDDLELIASEDASDRLVTAMLLLGAAGLVLGVVVFGIAVALIQTGWMR